MLLRQWRNIHLWPATMPLPPALVCCRRAMVIAPKTLLAHWAKELGVCGVGRMTHEFFGTESERCEYYSTVRGFLCVCTMPGVPLVCTAAGQCLQTMPLGINVT